MGMAQVMLAALILSVGTWSASAETVAVISDSTWRANLPRDAYGSVAEGTVLVGLLWRMHRRRLSLLYLRERLYQKTPCPIFASDLA